MTGLRSPSPLDRLAEFTRAHAPRLEAERRAQAAAERARAMKAAAEHAACAYTTCFSSQGDPPPDLHWTGYPRGQDTDSLRVLATAYLGNGLFLAYRPYNHQRRDGIGTFTLVGLDHPDHATGRNTGAAHIPDLAALAEALERMPAGRGHVEAARINHDRCAICSVELPPTPPGRTPRTYCSNACRARAYRTRLKTRQHIN